MVDGTAKLCDCGHVEDEHDQKRFRFGPCGVAGCDCQQFSYSDDIDVYDEEIGQATPINESPSYRSSMTDAGRGHLLP